MEEEFCIACSKGNNDKVKQFLNYNSNNNHHSNSNINNQQIDLNYENESGRTPFYFACRAGHIEIVELLLNDDRIDVNKANRYDKTPF